MQCARKLIFILGNQILNLLGVIVDKLLLRILLLLDISLSDGCLRSGELTLLKNCHNIAHVCLILISYNLFSVNLITSWLRPICLIFLPVLIRDSWYLGLIRIFNVQVIHATLLVPLAILAAQNIIFGGVWKSANVLTVKVSSLSHWF